MGQTSRINLLSVLAGILVTLASMFFFMSLAAALGFWSYQINELPSLGPQFWKVASIAWIFSVFLGTLLTAIAARTRTIKNGIINSITTWAGSYLLFGGMALSIAESNLQSYFSSTMIGLFWSGFIGDALALSAGLLGGFLGTKFEQKCQKQKKTFLLSKSSDKISSS